MPEVGFEPTHPKITELKSAALDHSAIQAHYISNGMCIHAMLCVCLFDCTTAVGFEPTRAEPIRFRI